MRKKTLSIVIAVLSSFVAVFLLLFKVFIPGGIKSANFTTAYATMSNSRFSYYAGVTSGGAGSSNITIDTASYPDKDVDHLFPKDSVCFANATLDGCIDNTSYVVSSTEGVDGDQFVISTPLTTALESTDVVIATQSGIITLTVTLATTVPDQGDIYITIPMADNITNGDGNDGIPDFKTANTTISTSGFDLNGITATNLGISTTTSGTCNNAHWSVGTATITPGTGTGDHTIRIDRSGSSCEANNTTLTITLGDASVGIVNPPPIYDVGRTQGEADEYTINVKTRDETNTTIDNSNVMIAPNSVQLLRVQT